jgi:hypothetical protein
MVRTLTILGTVTVLLGCGANHAPQPDAPAVATVHDLDVLTERVKALEARVQETQSLLAQAQDSRNDLRMRLQVIEARFMTTAGGQPTAAAATAPRQTEAAPAPHRGTFTDFGGSPGAAIIASGGISRSTPPMPSSAPVRPASSDGGIIAHCANEWPGNVGMQVSCQESEEQAKAKFNAIRDDIATIDEQAIKRGCNQYRPDNYVMKVSCVERETQLMKQAKGH